MENQQVEILGIPFTGGTRVDFINKRLKPRIMNGEKTFIVTANPEIVELAVHDPEYRININHADYIVPDGIGIIVASRMLKQPLQERITGFETMLDLFTLADANGLKVYMLGAQEHVVKRAAEKVKTEYPGLILAGWHHGFFDVEKDALASEIASLEPDLIFVATGAPRQEKWIALHQGKFKKGLFMGVGGCFDILGGELKGAPPLWKKYHAEWLYRLLEQPSRWRRMLAIPRFLVRVAKSRKM
ncbi:WecB/TagA/CpsF family glycosyltransferase [Peribacillus sp. SCS-37]|uniref:WecB/TagA/CpsF family glycosyltransferase n=1 Tax=Paraperibacillus esterisolvens TaxID=3115296 RepID=UPI0039069900